MNWSIAHSAIHWLFGRAFLRALTGVVLVMASLTLAHASQPSEDWGRSLFFAQPGDRVMGRVYAPAPVPVFDPAPTVSQAAIASADVLRSIKELDSSLDVALNNQTVPRVDGRVITVGSIVGGVEPSEVAGGFPGEGTFKTEIPVARVFEEIDQALTERAISAYRSSDLMAPSETDLSSAEVARDLAKTDLAKTDLLASNASDSGLSDATIRSSLPLQTSSSHLKPANSDPVALRPLEAFDKKSHERSEPSAQQELQQIPQAPSGQDASRQKSEPATTLVDASLRLASQPEARREGSDQATSEIRLNSWQPAKKSSGIRIQVIDDESLMAEAAQVIEGARVSWVGSESELSSHSDARGVADLAMTHPVSVRFFVSAPGYLMATGYAVAGVLSPVLMVKAERAPLMLKSVQHLPTGYQYQLIGKVVSGDLKPVSQIQIEVSQVHSQNIFYSAGPLGFFSRAARLTGMWGEFLAGAVEPGLVYVMPTAHQESDSNGEEWPAYLMTMDSRDTMLSTTLLEPQQASLKIDVVDDEIFEKPATTVTATVGGQRGVSVMGTDGRIQLDSLFIRNSVDLVELSAAPYPKTWLSLGARRDEVRTVSLFSERRIRELAGERSVEWLQKGFVFGHLAPERFGPTEIQVLGSRGKAAEGAEVIYLDRQGLPHSDKTRTDKVVQLFVILGLAPGEYHVVARDAAGKTQSVQVLRTESGVISQLFF